MPDKTWNKLKTQSISDKDRERMRMGYEIPLKDDVPDWYLVAYKLRSTPNPEAQLILQALYNFTLEEAAEVAAAEIKKAILSKDQMVIPNVALTIRALKEPTT